MQFASEKDHQIHDIVHISLREILQPASKWFDNVNRLESILGLHLVDAGGENSVWKSSRYFVPYVYEHPMYVEMLHERHPKAQTLDLREVAMFSQKRCRRLDNTYSNKNSTIS